MNNELEEENQPLAESVAFKLNDKIRNIAQELDCDIEADVYFLTRIAATEILLEHASRSDLLARLNMERDLASRDRMAVVFLRRELLKSAEEVVGYRDREQVLRLVEVELALRPVAAPVAQQRPVPQGAFNAGIFAAQVPLAPLRRRSCFIERPVRPN